MIEIHKQKMINELIQQINSWNEYSDKIYGYSKNDAENFLKRLQVGIYNSILKNSYWFVTPPTLDNLIQIEVNKKIINSLTNISEENYIVYSAIHEIKEHIDYLYYWYKSYKVPYYTKENRYEQTPMSYEENNNFTKLYDKVLKNNYTWHEAKHIITNLKHFNVKENKDFPHNIKEIEKIFNSTPTLLFKKYEKEKVKYSSNILKLNKVITNLQNTLTEETINDFINKKRKNKYEEYIRVILHNTKVNDINKTTDILNSLLVEKKLIDISDSSVPQPYLTNLRKHYSFIYNHTTEIEYLEESSDILNNLYNVYKDNNDMLYQISLIYNKLLISYGIIPIPLTTKLLESSNKTKQIIDKTIDLANYLNKG